MGEVFLFAKTDCYGNSIGVHWVKHDGLEKNVTHERNKKHSLVVFTNGSMTCLFAIFIFKEMIDSEYFIDPP